MGKLKKLNMKKIFTLSFVIYFISISYGYSTERKIGDILQLALPVTALSSTYYMNDFDGFKSN